MDKRTIITSMKMDADFHQLLRTLAGYQRRSLSSLMNYLMLEALREKKKDLELPKWIDEEDDFNKILDFAQ
jgi:hypothetical protein